MPEPIDLERELRAIAPRPRPEFRANLVTQVAQGFPRPARGWRLPRLQILVPALGTGLAAVLAVAVVLGTRGGSDDATTSSPDVAVQRESAAPAPQADSGAAAIAPAPEEGRRVERSARLELGARAGRFQAVSDGVVRTTQRFGGFVSTSQIGRFRDFTHSSQSRWCPGDLYSFTSFSPSGSLMMSPGSLAR